jgi:transcriptional regulator with GAF, ATPase, and Fis domain
VRELENILERAVILSAGRLLDIDPEVLEHTSSESPAKVAGSLEEIQKSHILHVLRQTRWVIDGAQGAAAILGMHPNTLRSRLKKLGLSRPGHERS